MNNFDPYVNLTYNLLDCTNRYVNYLENELFELHQHRQFNRDKDLEILRLKEEIIKQRGDIDKLKNKVNEEKNRRRVVSCLVSFLYNLISFLHRRIYVLNTILLQVQGIISKQ